MLVSAYSGWKRALEGFGGASFHALETTILPAHGIYRLPDFLGVGPGRTATSWLNHVLQFRANLPANLKETKFFGGYYYKGIDWYAWHFRNADPLRPVGEVCPYFARAHARNRIKQHLPDAQIICTMRDPVDRLYSNYKMLRYHGIVRGTFMENVRRGHPMLEQNRYATHLRDWFDLFGRENVLILFFWELKEDQQRYIDRVTDFLAMTRIGLTEIPPPSRRNINSFARAPRSRHLAKLGRHCRNRLRHLGFYRTMNVLEAVGVWEFCGGRGDSYPHLSAEEDAAVRERFFPEIDALERVLGCDLSAWRMPAYERRNTPSDSEAQSGESAHDWASA